MTSTISFCRQSHHCQDNLVFQFILAEFLVVYPCILELQTQLHSKMFSNEQFEKSLEYLGGESAFIYGKCFPWSFTEGRLAKLNCHCLHFMRITKETEQTSQLHRHIDQAFVYCMQALSALKTDLKSRVDVGALLQKMISEMGFFADVLFFVLENYKDDENTLFFLLHSAAKLDLLYKPGFTANLLLNFGEKNLEELEAYITKAYRKRGFFHLLPIIHSLFVQLPKEVLNNKL